MFVTPWSVIASTIFAGFTCAGFVGVHVRNLQQSSPEPDLKSAKSGNVGQINFIGTDSKVRLDVVNLRVKNTVCIITPLSPARYSP